MAHWAFWDWVAYGCLGISACGMAFGAVWKEFPAMFKSWPAFLTSPRWSVVPAVLFGIASVILIYRVVMLSDPSSDPVKPPASTATSKFIENISIGLSGRENDPIIVIGTIATTTERLRIFVDYSTAFAGRPVPPHGPSIHLIDFIDKVRGQAVEIPLVRKERVEQRSTEYWWGHSNDGVPGPGLTNLGTVVYARLIIIGRSTEAPQYHPFEIVWPDTKTLPFVIFPTSRSDWAKDWDR